MTATSFLSLLVILGVALSVPIYKGNANSIFNSRARTKATPSLSSQSSHNRSYNDEFTLEYLRSLTPAQAAQLTIEQFEYGYNAYKKYAWGCDELYPMTKACHNFYSISLMWTPIDALG